MYSSVKAGTNRRIGVPGNAENGIGEWKNRGPPPLRFPISPFRSFFLRCLRFSPSPFRLFVQIEDSLLAQFSLLSDNRPAKLLS